MGVNHFYMMLPLHSKFDRIFKLKMMNFFLAMNNYSGDFLCGTSAFGYSVILLFNSSVS